MPGVFFFATDLITTLAGPLFAVLRDARLTAVPGAFLGLPGPRFFGAGVWATTVAIASS